MIMRNLSRRMGVVWLIIYIYYCRFYIFTLRAEYDCFCHVLRKSRDDSKTVLICHNTVLKTRITLYIFCHVLMALLTGFFMRFVSCYTQIPLRFSMSRLTLWAVTYLRKDPCRVECDDIYETELCRYGPLLRQP